MLEIPGTIEGGDEYCARTVYFNGTVGGSKRLNDPRGR
jgi:hypothetical protein